MLGVYIVKMNIQFNEISNLDCFHVIFILDENTTNNILFFELSFDFQLLHSFQMMNFDFHVCFILWPYLICCPAEKTTTYLYD